MKTIRVKYNYDQHVGIFSMDFVCGKVLELEQQTITLDNNSINSTGREALLKSALWLQESAEKEMLKLVYFFTSNINDTKTLYNRMKRDHIMLSPSGTHLIKFKK